MKREKTQELVLDIEKILNKVHADQKKPEVITSDVHPIHRKSALNLINYLSLRSFDLRRVQRKLGYLGMSRIARAESHVEASLRTTLFYLRTLLGEKTFFPVKSNISIKSSEKLLEKNTTELLGKAGKKRRLRLMVTMPTEAATDPELVTRMVKRGMNVARINCAHDTPEIWEKMIGNIRDAEKCLGLEVKVAMDLNGPKIRTGHLSKSLQIIEGDILKLCKEPIHGINAVRDADENVITPATVACTLPLALNYVKVGCIVYFDDGEIKGHVLEVHENHLIIRIVRASSKGSRLKADKGINFPDAYIPIRGLTDLDKQHLRFISVHADIVNCSYVNSAEDVSEVINELTALGALDRLGVILKIETQAAYNNLVEIILEGLKIPKIGVMIARGDLALEAGWGRMGSIQKEMLAICNATHVPIVWATQVMEKLAKKGYPSRAEITDAVTAVKAECIMLNKGKYILKAIELLDQITVSSERYQDKNAPMLPMLERIKQEEVTA